MTRAVAPPPGSSIWLRRVQRLLVALVAAMFLWLSIINRQDPMLVRTVDNVPIPCPTLPHSGLLCTPIEETLYVALRAPQSVWDDLPLPLVQYLNVTLTPREQRLTLQPGTLPFHCQVDMLSTDVEILAYDLQSTSPDTPCEVAVTLQDPAADPAAPSGISDVLLPVTLERVGEIPAGFILESLLLDQRYVNVQGPQGKLDTISRAQVFFPFYSYIFQASEGDFSMPLPIQLLDREGNAVTDLELDPDTVTVSLQYSALPNTRRVSVVPTPSITVPSGYVLKAVQSEPEYVILQGAAELLDTIADPLPVPSETPIEPPIRTTSFTAPLTLPDGLTANVTEVTFTLEVTHVILDNTQRAVARCNVENPDFVYDFAPIFLHLRGPYEAFNLLYAMAADEEFAWTVVYDCPEETGTFNLSPIRFIFRHEDIEVSDQITKISHDPPVMQLTIRHPAPQEP